MKTKANDFRNVITQWVDRDRIIPICPNCNSGDTYFVCSLDECDLWHCNRCGVESEIVDEEELTVDRGADRIEYDAYEK